VLARETQRRPAFSMIVIEILQPNPKAKNVSMAADHKRMEDPLMKPEYPYFSNCSSDGANEDELKAPSRFIDEKISDESDTESHVDSALKPAGLNNPFWN
jgi:hypothetical protein